MKKRIVPVSKGKLALDRLIKRELGKFKEAKAKPPPPPPDNPLTTERADPLMTEKGNKGIVA